MLCFDLASFLLCSNSKIYHQWDLEAKFVDCRSVEIRKSEPKDAIVKMATLLLLVCALFVVNVVAYPQPGDAVMDLANSFNGGNLIMTSKCLE